MFDAVVYRHQWNKGIVISMDERQSGDIVERFGMSRGSMVVNIGMTGQRDWYLSEPYTLGTLHNLDVHHALETRHVAPHPRCIDSYRSNLPLDINPSVFFPVQIALHNLSKALAHRVNYATDLGYHS